MNENLTEIVAIFDRSGSMGDLQEDTIGGFNTFVEKQKKKLKKQFNYSYLLSTLL